ncbi:molybdopterin synthase catalytic subunit MoaE [Alginatibacterium sediminis]|uniref:Molybdopterin synthase catalytic subunit n=1 Tax=Alginatibacterium sediminis TaxID=2164068 RepID=A0A420EHG6_9ALTE|nr:molybdopterin synthase catalytic subunit MoaE [Alginatibacterium sediminis]RKF20152.1 molybdopterin synthase catalytic subunit MoaE [Alginatibacterium sediminis]
MTFSRVSVQTQVFDVAERYASLASNSSAGAVVTFVGHVRDMNLGQTIQSLELEHYPGMTEKVLEQINLEAIERFDINGLDVVHRVGVLDVNEAIVFVGVSSAHRGDAFQACEFVMDALKTRAPFWKKEQGSDNTAWVSHRDSDSQAVERWAKK